MNKTKLKNNPLIQHLCKHISALEQTNAKLQEQLCQADADKDAVCLAMGYPSWRSLLDSLQVNSSTSKKTQQLADTINTLKSGQQTSQFKTGLSCGRTPLREYHSNFESQCFSPIESESRILNKGIRGGTDRTVYQEVENQPPSFQQPTPSQSNQFQNNRKSQPYCLSLSHMATHSISKQSLRLQSAEQQNVLLSIENTKLRQRVHALEAVVASRQYY